MNVKVIMEKIENYNCEGLCQQETCDKKYTQYAIVKINGMDIHLAFCDEHAREFEIRGVLSEKRKPNPNLLPFPKPKPYKP